MTTTTLDRVLKPFLSSPTQLFSNMSEKKNKNNKAKTTTTKKTTTAGVSKSIRPHPFVEEVEVEDHSHHLPYNAMKGISGRGTIRFKGVIQGHELQILLDGGSSDNFIQPRIAKFLQLPIHEAPRFKVLVGNGHQLECEGEVRQVPVHIQGHSIQVSAYVLPIAAVNLVLGTQWLAKLDTHLVNYRRRFITFFLNGELITF